MIYVTFASPLVHLVYMFADSGWYLASVIRRICPMTARRNQAERGSLMLCRSPQPDVTGLLADLAGQLSLRIGYGEAGLTLAHPDGRAAETWREQYPYPALMSRGEYARTKLAAGGITLIKLWVSVSRTEQLSRFVHRHSDPLRRWKLSPVDLASLDRWDDYTAAKESMFGRTATPCAPWAVIKSNDKRRCRVEAIRYVLSCLPYTGRDDRAAGRPDPLIARRLDTSYRATPAAIPAFSDSVSR
jgi:Polyphosphate kinase 2 (PPK2)